MKIVNVEFSQEVFDKLAISAKKNKRSIRAEVAIIVESQLSIGVESSQPVDYVK